MNAPTSCDVRIGCTMIRATACRCFAMDSNEMSWPAMATPNMKPLSWLGMKPVGMVKNR